ncbi:MAG TPA: hypothetical protein VE153_21535 [Myxococcus sp.]|jgi:ssDNA-binding Zn-finger/Zn-ribbon topoisomerase 1|nr:hypothetical protein [Myxococcus sp.]
MTPGPIHVIACPGCGQLHRALSLASGNTFGAFSWTDGRIIAPMSPEFPRCTRCPRCAAFFWVHRAREVGSYDEMSAFRDDRLFDVRLEVMKPSCG